MSKVVALIARIVVFSLIFNESSFSLLISILSTEHYNLCRKKLEKEDLVGEWSAKYVVKRINEFKANENRYFVLGLPTGI